MRPLSQLMDLTGRAALVTGGAGHLGQAAAEALIELGARVALADRDGAACRSAALRLSAAKSGAAVALVADLSREEACRSLVRSAAGELGRLDILVHCAAYCGDKRLRGWAEPLEKQTPAAFEKALKVNLSAAFLLSQQARKALTRSGRGSIILFGSIYGLVGPDWGLYAGTRLANPVGYGASKGGLLQVMRYLATAYAPSVRVNTISPGGVLRGQPAAFRRRYESRAPLGRMAVEEDIKGAVAYLASDLSAYVTGHNLVVDGGWTAW